MRIASMLTGVILAVFLAGAALAASSSTSTTVLADNLMVNSVPMRKGAEGDAFRTKVFQSSWVGTYTPEQGAPVKLEIRAAAIRSIQGAYSYIWRDTYSRMGNTDLVVELFVDGQKVMFLESPGQTSIGFDHLLPSQKSVEVFIDAATFSTSMLFDVRVVRDMPDLDALE
ncbi:MAG: hypothetical protein AB7D47_10700 [Desulfovibrio sp.]|jgi:hypothetical protein